MEDKDKATSVPYTSIKVHQSTHRSSGQSNLESSLVHVPDNSVFVPTIEVPLGFKRVKIAVSCAARTGTRRLAARRARTLEARLVLETFPRVQSGICECTSYGGVSSAWKVVKE